VVDREADIKGLQRKILAAAVRPMSAGFGSSGIRLRNGRTLPFIVQREWSAPAGHYAETWYLVHPETREVYFEGPLRDALVMGLQSATELTDEVVKPIELAAGTYHVVFALGGQMGGRLDVEVRELGAEEAA
jgi:hypothetical protein